MKRKVLAQLDEESPEDVIVASNSSSYPISELIKGLGLRGERRVLSAHSCELLRVTSEYTDCKADWPPETPGNVVSLQHGEVAN